MIFSEKDGVQMAMDIYDKKVTHVFEIENDITVE